MSDNRELTTGKEALTPAQKQKQRLDQFMGLLEKRSQDLATLLSDSGVDPKVFLAVARRALQNNPDILNCTSASILKAFIDAATDGLAPDGRKAAIVVYKSKDGKVAQYQPMYAGLLDLAYRSGNFQSIEARVVYDGDFFEYELGDDPWIKHRPATRSAGTRRDIVAAYAVAKTVNGGVFREVFEGDDIRKVNAVSRATNGPGKAWPEEMARKGPLRRMWKFLPKDKAMERIAEHDNENYDLDALDVSTPEPERKLKPGFAPPAPAAIEQGADIVMETAMPEAEEVLDADFEETEVVEPAPAKQAPAPLEKAEPLEEAPPAKEWDVFMVSLEVANTWLNIKQALRSLAKWEQFPAARREAFIQSWTRFEQLRSDGGERTDFLDDNTLWEVWLVGANPPQDAIDGNWRVFQKTTNFQKASPEEQERLRALVEPAQG